MNQETVIHGATSDAQPRYARCGDERAETITTNLAAMTCAACITDARDAIRGNLSWQREKIAELGTTLAQLNRDGNAMPPLLDAALVVLDRELETLKMRLEVEATAAQADNDGASDAE